jgi:hypothetical protein
LLYESPPYVAVAAPSSKGTIFLHFTGISNIIAHMDIELGGFSLDNGQTLFDLPNLHGDYFHGYYGTPYPNLGWHGWNDRKSSLVVWPQ